MGAGTQAEDLRRMGVWAATAAVIGEAISLGIFLTPAGMAKSLGSPLLLGGIWCGMAALTLAGALCFTELAVRQPEDGGEYLYLRRWFGPRVAFLYGWMAAVVMYPGVAAALTVGILPYVEALGLVPPRFVPAVPAILLLAAGALNYLGATLSRGTMAVLNWIKILMLAALVGWAFLSGHAAIENVLPLAARRPGSDPLFDAVAGAAIGAFFCFGGWWEAGKIAGQVRNPSRNLAVAFSGGVAIVAATYLMLSLAFVAVVPIEQIGSNAAFVALFGSALFGASGARVLAVCVVLCVLGGLMVLTMAVPRVTMALAREEAGKAARGPLASFARLHPRFQTPANAVLLQTGMSLVVLAFGAFDRILAYVILPSVVFLALTAATLFRARPIIDRWWYPLAPLVFIAGSGLLAALLLLHNPAASLAGALIVLCGWPLRWLLLRQSRESPRLSETAAHEEDVFLDT